MDLYQVLCVFLLGIVSTCSGKVNQRRSIFFTDSVERTQFCTNERKPCMVMVRDYHSNGTLKSEFRTSNVCRCIGSDTCPTTWEEDGERSITRYLRTRGSIMTLQLKFCRTVQVEQPCRPHQVALTLKGPSFMPQEVKSVNCRCSGNAPMYKQKVWVDWTSPNVRNENYVCEMADCAYGRVTCLSHFRNSTIMQDTYVCRCTDGRHCSRVMASRGMGSRGMGSRRSSIGVCRYDFPRHK